MNTDTERKQNKAINEIKRKQKEMRKQLLCEGCNNPKCMVDYECEKEK